MTTQRRNAIGQFLPSPHWLIRLDLFEVKQDGETVGRAVELVAGGSEEVRGMFLDAAASLHEVSSAEDQLSGWEAFV